MELNLGCRGQLSPWRRLFRKLIAITTANNTKILIAILLKVEDSSDAHLLLTSHNGKMLPIWKAIFLNLLTQNMGI